MSRSPLGGAALRSLTLGGLVVLATLVAAPAASALCTPPDPPLKVTLKYQNAPANATFSPLPAAPPIRIVLQIENCSGAPVLVPDRFSSTDFFRRLYFIDPNGGTSINKAEETLHAYDPIFFCNTRNRVLLPHTTPVAPIEVLAGPQGEPAKPHFFREYVLDDARKLYDLTLAGHYSVTAEIELLTFDAGNPDAVFSDCGELPGTTVVNVGALSGRREFTLVSNALEFIMAGGCASDPSAAVTRAVDPSGASHGVPSYTKLQAAYNAAADCANEVIGLFGNLTENVVLGGNKTLSITQSAPVQITAADSSRPAVDITSTGRLTIVGPGTTGGTVGWRVGGNGAHFLKGVRASRSQNGIQVLSDGNTVDGASLQQNTRNGMLVSGSGNAIRGTTAQGSGQSGFSVTGATNALDSSTATSNTGDGFKIDGSGNRVGGSTAQSNGQAGFNVTSGANLLDTSTASSNSGAGFKVAGAGNTVRNSTAQQNGQDGFNSTTTGANTLFDSNTANKNTGDGFEINGAANILTNNKSNTGVSGGATENGGAEYRLNAVAIDGGGNMADGIVIPKNTAPKKCASFPAKGTCE